jgi:UDP:flavonoid glycosyltransferase YjiC (YdhE family)
MHALLIAIGSTGDMLPFCELARRLRARGHDVTIAANPWFARMVTRHGLDRGPEATRLFGGCGAESARIEFIPLGEEADYDRLCASAAFDSRGRGLRLIMQYSATLIEPVLALAAAHRTSLTVAHPLAFGARLAAERLGVRTTTLLLSPAILDSADSWFKRLIIRSVVAPPLARFADFGGEPVIALFPRWFSAPRPTWPAQLAQTNFALPDDDDGATHDEAEDFFADGAAPLVITAGSPRRRAHRFFAAAADAVTRLRTRAIFLTQYREQLPSLPAGSRHFSYLPLRRFLPRAAALVHHGGIGSAATALAAGVPQLVVPFAHDQFDNAARLRALGVADVIPAARVGGARVATALARLLAAPDTAAHTAEVAARLQLRDGLGETTALLERHAGAQAQAAEAPLMSAHSAGLHQ